MASFHARSVRCFTTSARLLRKPNIQRPIVPGTERRLLDAVTVPVFPPDLRPLPVKCSEEMTRRQEERKSELSEAYKAFRLNQAVRVFTDHKMVAVCHALPMTPRENLALRTKLKKADLRLIFMKNEIAIKATEGTKFHNLLPYFTSTNVYIISEEAKVDELVKVLKKISELHLLGGLVEDRILSREAMMNAAKLPPLDTMRGELLTILKASASKTSRLLGSHQQELSRCLQQLADPTPSPPTASSDASSSSSSPSSTTVGVHS